MQLHLTSIRQSVKIFKIFNGVRNKIDELNKMIKIRNG